MGVLLSLIVPASYAASPDIFPLSQIEPGMKGEALTIFSGDQIEKFDLVVIGVMPNFMGPKESIILVQLVGPKVEHTGVVAGMSGSPVYIEGKLAGALSLKLGTFTKEPLAGVTPIENILSLPTGQPGAIGAEVPQGAAGAEPVSTMQQFEMPPVWTSRSGVPGGSFLQPIDSPLVFSGFSAVAIRQFADAFAAYGMEATQGGTTDARVIALHGRGVPSLVLGFPARYIHSHAGIIHTDDYDSALKFILELLKALSPEAARDLMAE
jgi:hypothetical protein